MADEKTLDQIQAVLQLEGQALLECAARIDREPTKSQYLEAIRLLENAGQKNKKIIVTGVGKSGKIAQKIAATLSSTGTQAVFLHPTEGLHGDLGLVQEGDCVLALSHSGNTKELLELLPSIKSRGVSLVVISGNRQSQLGQEADAFCDSNVAQEACPHDLAPTTSTTLALAIGDALAIALMKAKEFGLESFARNHPGGALGKKLSLRVRDLMHSGDAVGTVTPDTLVDEIIVVSTEKKLGGILVVENGDLQGLITDGDLRRALKHRQQFFDLKAADLMTKEPTTIEPDQLAFEALRLMEDRDSQISVLPVATRHDNKLKYYGLVRLHDIVRAF